MPDPVPQNSASSSVQASPPIDLSGLRARPVMQAPASAGIDLSGLRTRTIQQAQSDLPQPKIIPPWQEVPTLPEQPTTKLGQAYEDAKSWLSKHEKNISEEYLAPFRRGLDKIADDIEGSPYIKSASPTAKGVAYGTAELLRQVPVASDVKSTVLANVVPPELGPEGKALKAGEKADQWRPHDLGKEHNLPSEEGYAYHATNEERARDIAESGGMRTHKPWEHTDQDAWPDGSTEKRIYFTPNASSAWQFAPEEGKSVLLRVKKDAANLRLEGTGDLYSQKPIHHKNVEILGDDKQWHRVSDLTTPKAEQKPKSKSLADELFDSAPAKLGPKQGGHAGGGVASEEELARPGRFVKISKSGMPTDQGKTPDFNLKAGEAGYQVKPDGTWELKAGQESSATKAGVQNYAREVFR